MWATPISDLFASGDAIADAKGEILGRPDRATCSSRTANDPRVMARARQFAGRVVTFGIDTAADVSAADVVHRGLDGVTARVRTPAGESALTTPLLGLGNLSNVLAASAVTIDFGTGV